MDCLNLVSKFDGKTIKLPILLDPASVIANVQSRGYQLVLDTGADTSALTEEFLMRNGYTKFYRSGAKKNTATGEVELCTCEINGFLRHYNHRRRIFVIITREIMNLIAELEYLIGKECYNPKSFDGYTQEEGRGYRYPVVIETLGENGKEKLAKYRGKFNGRNIMAIQHGIDACDPENLSSIKYKLGANHLYVGLGIKNILEFLENRYGIDFNQLEDNVEVE